MRKKATRSSSPAKTKPNSGGFTINTNTIVGLVTTVMGAIIIFMVTGAMTANKETSKTVSTISTQLPYLQKSIDTTDAGVKEANKDLKEAKAQMVTRQELDNKHAQLQDAIKNVKEDVKDVRLEQKRLADDMSKQRKED